MSIEIFEKTYDDYSLAGTIQDLLLDVGFSDVAYTSSNSSVDFSSASGVYGCKSFSIYNYSSDVASKFVAIKDDSRKALIILPEFTGNTITGVPSYRIVALVIVDGFTPYFDADDLSKWTNVVGGRIKSSTDSSDVLLAPLINVSAHIFSPFYVALNRVNHPINTVVTDGVNSFTSLGNLFYIKNA